MRVCVCVQERKDIGPEALQDKTAVFLKKAFSGVCVRTAAKKQRVESNRLKYGEKGSVERHHTRPLFCYTV